MVVVSKQDPVQASVLDVVLVKVTVMDPDMVTVVGTVTVKMTKTIIEIGKIKFGFSRIINTQIRHHNHDTSDGSGKGYGNGKGNGNC